MPWYAWVLLIGPHAMGLGNVFWRWLVCEYD